MPVAFIREHVRLKNFISMASVKGEEDDVNQFKEIENSTIINIKLLDKQQIHASSVMSLEFDVPPTQFDNDKLESDSVTFEQNARIDADDGIYLEPQSPEADFKKEELEKTTIDDNPSSPKLSENYCQPDNDPYVFDDDMRKTMVSNNVDEDYTANNTACNGSFPSDSHSEKPYHRNSTSSYSSSCESLSLRRNSFTSNNQSEENVPSYTIAETYHSNHEHRNESFSEEVDVKNCSDFDEDECEDRLVIAEDNEDNSVASSRIQTYPSLSLNSENNEKGATKLGFSKTDLNGRKTGAVRRKQNRFNGLTEEDVAKMVLPDLICNDLDILIIGINPGMYAAYKGHHYAGPGNHFWKCMFLSGLLPRPMTADDDKQLMSYGIGFTNIVERTTRGSGNLSRKEIVSGTLSLLDKIQTFKPRIAVFNGKGIYEVFSGNKEFLLGKQPDKLDGTNTHVWVMPNSSARCAQLPRAVDKVPFYSALKKFRDYLTGVISHVDQEELVFRDVKLKDFNDSISTKKWLKTVMGSAPLSTSSSENTVKTEEEKSDEQEAPQNFILGSNNEDPSIVAMSSCLQLDIRIDPTTGKKKRGRPPKPRPDGTFPTPKRRLLDSEGRPLARGCNPIDPLTGKKKRGRPKKGETTLTKLGEFSMGNSPERRICGGGGSIYNSDNDAEEVKIPARPLAPPIPPFSHEFGSGFRPRPVANSHSTTPKEENGSCYCSDPQKSSLEIHCGYHEGRNERYHHVAYNGDMSVYPRMEGTPPETYSDQNVSSPYCLDRRVALPPPPVPSSNFELHRNKLDDVSSKSITGLESLVEQIPASRNENEPSSIFSSGSSDMGGGGPPYSPSTSGTSHFHSVSPSSHYGGGFGPPNPYGRSPCRLDSPYDEQNSSNSNYTSGQSSSSAIVTPSTPSNFSVSSLVQHVDASSPPLVPSDSAAFSMSNLTAASYAAVAAHAAAGKYHHAAAAAAVGYSTAASFGSFPSGFGSSNSLMGGTGQISAADMASHMSYYSQYGHPGTVGAYSGSGGHPTSFGSAYGTPHGPLQVPNPSYPYPSPYAQSHYSQSHYF